MKESSSTEGQESNSPKPKSKGMSKSTKIIVGVVGGFVVLSILCVLIILLIYFLRNRDSSDTNGSTVTSETSETTVTTTTTSETTTTTTTTDALPTILTYTHPNYPGFAITYDDTWTLTDYEEEGIDEGALDLYVELEKGNMTMTYFIGAYIVYGGVPTCYLYDEYEIEYIGTGWSRIESMNGYYYSNSAVINGIDMGEDYDFESVFEGWGGMYGEHDIDDYEFCDFDAPIPQGTLLEIPEDVYPGGDYYIGGAGISVEFSGAESPRLLEQADRIVKGTVFGGAE